MKQDSGLILESDSVCPVCHRILQGQYRSRNGKVYYEKECDIHGRFSGICGAEADFCTWIENKVINIPPSHVLKQGRKGHCPFNCGVCTEHLQTACCVLLEVTERCNQMCPYCFAGARKKGDDLPFDVIERKLDFLMNHGDEIPFNLQLSGGEPTVRDDLPEIIRSARRKGFKNIQINTNGKRLAEEAGYAATLKEAGATVIYLQFDGVDDGVYERLRNEALFRIKKTAIEQCRGAELPVTLVPMIVREVNLKQIGSIVEFALDHLDVVKGIHFQPVSFFGRYPDVRGDTGSDYGNRVTMFDVMHGLEEQMEGSIKYSDFCPITTGHTLCCFYGLFQNVPGKGIQSLLNDRMKRSGVGCCGEIDPVEIIRKDRNFVYNKWKIPQKGGCCEKQTAASLINDDSAESDGAVDLDAFIEAYETNVFTISGMAFMDAYNLDTERLKRCRVQVLSKDDSLIPFCAYNSLYRGGKND